MNRSQISRNAGARKKAIIKRSKQEEELHKQIEDLGNELTQQKIEIINLNKNLKEMEQEAIKYNRQVYHLSKEKIISKSPYI